MEFHIHKRSVPPAPPGGDMNCLRLAHTVGKLFGLLGHLAIGDDLIHFPPEKLLSE